MPRHTQEHKQFYKSKIQSHSRTQKEYRKMPRKPEPLEPWMLEAINLMVRQNLTLRQAASQLRVDITPQEADNIQGRIRFQDALEEARLTYFANVGSNPRLTREVVEGQLYKLVERLANDREDYKAADALLKLSKIKGWVGEPEHKPSLIDGLTQSDIDRLRAQIKKAEEQGQQEFDLAKAIVEIKAPKGN